MPLWLDMVGGGGYSFGYEPNAVDRSVLLCKMRFFCGKLVRRFFMWRMFWLW